jgi:hypothetical protein
LDATSRVVGQAGLHSQSLDQERRTRTRAEEALVPQRTEVAHPDAKGRISVVKRPTWPRPVASSKCSAGSALGIIADNVVNIGCAMEKWAAK